MEYISAEEFLKQDKEVQEVLLKWINKKITDYDLVQNGEEIMLYKDYLIRDKDKINLDSYPLFTEGQIRKLIEDKINSRIEVIFVDKEGVENEESYYRIERVHYLDGNLKNSVWLTEKSNLLQAYWKVALEIAKRCIE